MCELIKHPVHQGGNEFIPDLSSGCDTEQHAGNGFIPGPPHGDNIPAVVHDLESVNSRVVAPEDNLGRNVLAPGSKEFTILGKTAEYPLLSNDSCCPVRYDTTAEMLPSAGQPTTQTCLVHPSFEQQQLEPDAQCKKKSRFRWLKHKRVLYIANAVLLAAVITLLMLLLWFKSNENACASRRSADVGNGVGVTATTVALNEITTTPTPQSLRHHQNTTSISIPVDNVLVLCQDEARINCNTTIRNDYNCALPATDDQSVESLGRLCVNSHGVYGKFDYINSCGICRPGDIDLCIRNIKQRYMIADGCEQ